MKVAFGKRLISPSATLLAIAALACSGGQSGPSSASGGRCAALGAAPLTPLAALEWPTSTLFVQVAVPAERIIQILERRVPSLLAQAKDREIGAPGKATYQVRRGKPAVRADGKSVQVSVPIDATIDVCKPLGSFCLRYGHCEPAFTAHFRMGTQLDASYVLAPPRAELTVRKRCVIAMDVTPELTKMAEAELAKIEQRLASEIPPLKPHLERLLAEAAQPVPLQSESCVRAQPQSLLYASPRMHGGALGVGLGVTGSVQSVDCVEKAEPARTIPVQSVTEPPSEALLWLPQLLSLQSLAEHYRQRLVGSFNEGAVTAVRVVWGSDTARLHLSLEHEQCPELVVDARLAVDEASQSLLFEHLQFPEEIDPALVAAIRTHLQRNGTFPLRPLFDARNVQTRRVLDTLHRELEAVTSLKWEALPSTNGGRFAQTKGQTKVSAEGVLVALPVAGSWAVTAR